MHPVNFSLLSSLAELSLAAPPSSQPRLSSRQSDTSGWNPSADLAKPLKQVWDHCEKTYNGRDLYSFKNYGWDQIMATRVSCKGVCYAGILVANIISSVINYCVRWESDEPVPATQREQIAKEVDSAYQRWFKWVYGWDNFPSTMSK